MTKVIVVNTSPRAKGNCDLVGQHMAKRLEAAGAEVRLVDFRTLDIGYCQGCDACKAKDRAWCVRKDDWSTLIPAIDECDALAILTPLYFGEITAQAKTVLDRIYPWFNPSKEGMSLAKRFGKKVAVLTTSGTSPIADGEACAAKLAEPFGVAGFIESRVLAVNNVNEKGSAMNHAGYLARVDELTDWMCR